MATSPVQGRQFRDVFSRVITHKSTLNVANLADGAGSTEVVAVPGAELGDMVMVSFETDLLDVTVTGYVQAAGLVELRVQNESTGARDLASASVRIVVLKPNPDAFL